VVKLSHSHGFAGDAPASEWPFLVPYAARVVRLGATRLHFPRVKLACLAELGHTYATVAGAGARVVRQCAAVPLPAGAATTIHLPVSVPAGFFGPRAGLVDTFRTLTTALRDLPDEWRNRVDTSVGESGSNVPMHRQ